MMEMLTNSGRKVSLEHFLNLSSPINMSVGREIYNNRASNGRQDMHKTEMIT